jgi:hypothetical protein
MEAETVTWLLCDIMADDGSQTRLLAVAVASYADQSRNRPKVAIGVQRPIDLFADASHVEAAAAHILVGGPTEAEIIGAIQG